MSTRLDNLGVAREMKAEKKDAKAVKMATGWERGADGKEQTYEDGMFEQMVESGVLKRAQKTEEPSEAKVDLTDNQGNSTPQPDLSSESKGAEQSSGVQAEVPQAEVQENAPMPMRVVGKGKNAAQGEDWLATTPKRGHDYVFKESGLDAEEANAFVENKAAEAEKNLEKVKGKAPKMGTNIAAYKEAKADYEARVAEAQKAVDYWHAVKAERDKVLLEERRARKEKDKALYDDAVAQEEQRKAEMAQKAAEQEALGSNAVAPAIKEKWENAPKVDGGADEITLPNGEVVTGHYVLTESGAASASHQATNGFAETEGYPVDVNGETVNDRDYKRDAEAQQVTRGMAADYDSRALQSPVVVSGDGVVLSGNGRTMAGEIAAVNGSDAKYNAYLRGHAGKFGFTTEQVEGFEHPRVVFVPDGEMPYTSETFAKFNQREQKSQSRTEMAVKLGKVVDDALFGRVMDVIGRHESLAEFYADDAATASVVKELADAGVIPQTEMAQLFDGGRLSESGQAMVEGVLVGKVFQGSPDAVRQITEVKSMRKAVMAALPEVVACHRLGGGYDLSKELAAAVDLVYKARKAGFKLGQHVSQHARQGNLFQLDDGATVADYNNAAVMMLADVMNDGRVTQLKKVLSFYNTQAADSAQGIGDMFAGGVKSKGQIINEVNELLNNGQEYDRSTPSVADGQGVGGEGGEQGDVAGPSHQGGAGSERGLSEAFDGLAAQLKTAEGEERKRVLGEMRDGIARFAEENGYPVPEFLLTREDFLAAVPEKDRAKYVEWIDDGAHMPAYYTKGKVYVYVEGCETFDKDVNETLAHEYTHADNAEFPENVNALTYALEDTHEVTRDELREILREMSQGEHYDREAERLEAEGKDVNKMLADEVIAHAVARMVRDGEQVLDGITKNPTLQFIIKRAYKVRENERQYNIRARENAERHDNASEGDNRGGSNNGANVEGESANGGVGRPVNGSEGGEVSSERGRSTVSEGKEVAAPSEDGAKVGVTDGEKSSATGDVVPSGEGKTDNPRQQKAVGKSAQPPTREESILRDVVIEHMKGSGLDVIGTEDGQRVLDMVNEDGAKEHRVYHGSGAEFDHFDHSHMGEGEGAQAYGWGTYVTEVRGIGEGYAIRSKNGISMSREEWSLKRSELESNIYRAKEQLPFLKGEYKAEVEAQISEWEEQLKNYEPHNYLYTVEIPDDNGGNYLDWNGPVPAETIDRITEYLREKYGDEVVNGRWLSNPLLSSKGVDVSARNGAAIYRQLERALGSDKKASQLLSSLGYAGIKYPAEFRSGGRKDDAKNYVIFNENDAEITDHVRFFKTKNGEAYGFTVGGKIYYDPRIANAETPVHEYAHLWASALKANNAEEWKNVVDLMKGTKVWEEVKKTYPELETDDEIADEVLATYSGRRGAERLREEMRKAAAEGDGVMGKAEAVSALQRVKRAIDKFWKAVADFLHIHYTSAEEVADRVMKDLLDGVDPRSMMDGGKSLRPETRVNVVEAEAGHGFKNYAEAKTWAKEHIARTYSGEETGGKGDIRISNAAVDKYLSQSAVDKSESKDVHLAVLKVLPDVIRESVDAEQHADFKKGEDGVRSAANGVNPNVTIHRLYGAVRMDGKLYRVKVTLKENTRTKETPKAYSYEATKIELLEGSLSQTEGSHNLEPSNSKSEVSAGQHGNVSGLTSTFPRYSDKSITAAKLLNGVEKSYDGGKFFEDYNKIREQLIGEKGAESSDHADEVNTRLDNLGVAREMEAEKKDAKAIKMATGWERGADGKWRYEMPDAKIKETMDIDGHVVKRFDEDMLWNDGKLADVVDAPELFKAYPQLKETRIVTDAVTGDMPSAGDYNAKTNTITIHADELKYMNGILNHEVQHAIQKIEGFARGGSPAMVRSEIKRQMAEVTKQVRQLRAEGKEAEAKELIKKNRGLYEASVGDDDFGSYKSLAGEVESRNVERRMGMSAEERRASLAAETEDVSREDQIFLTSGDGGRSYSLKDKAEKTLAGVHNISKDKLRKALKLGGLANPSVAVIDTEKQNHSGFGEISLVLPSNMVAKRTGRNAGTFFGDAWTPTYPQVERIFGKGGSDRAIADIASVPEEMQRMTRNAIDSFMDGKNADNLVYLYLQEKGIAPQLVKTKGVFSPDIRKEVISLTNRQPFYKLNETERNKVVELYIKYKFDGDRDAFEKALQERVANLIELQKEYTNPKSLLARKVKEHLENIDNYGYDYEAICRFVDDVNRDDKVSGEVSDVGTMQEARNIVEKENLQKDFEQWKEGLADRYNTKEVIFNGFTPSGNRRYVDNTLKNVSKIMKQKGRNGAEGFGFSFNNFAASIMQSNGTLKGIKERKAQLTQQHEDIDAFTDKWGEVYNHLADALNPNADISTMDVGYYRLQETAVQKKPKEYAKKEYGVELSDEDVQQLNDMVKAIREERPTMYFETKFERPVTLDEFAAAVVPKDLSADVRSGLEKAGLKLYDYDPKVEGDRKRAFDEAVHGDEGVLFRTSDELDQEYGSRWIDEQTNEDGRHTTQVKNTINSYKKFGDWVKRDSDGRNVDVLDASSGLGLGTEWLRENGINVEDVEPYPSENRTAPTYISYGDVKKKYDYIISNAVLNVIPDDWRANVLHNMADKLKVGGKLVINVRGAESIRKQGKEGETRITLDDPSEILVLRPNGSIKAYQKGFTKAELKEWCETELGEGYSVEIANNKNAGGSYDTAVVVTKNNESGTIGVASEAGRPRRSAQAVPNSGAKLSMVQELTNNIEKLSDDISEKGEMGAHEFLFNVAKAFGLEGNNLNKSFYKDLGGSVGIRISDHYANADNITEKNSNDEVYGLVVKLSPQRFKSKSDANYLEYVYYPDKLTGERQREIVEGLNKFLQTGDYMQLPAPDRVNRSGKFDVLIDGRETSPTAKHQAANDLARQMDVEGEVEV